MTTWQVKIEGHRFDLDSLKKWLDSSCHEIVEHNGEPYLRSPVFERFERDDDVHQAAKELLAALNALAKVQRPSYIPVALGNLVVEVRDGQPKEEAVQRAARIFLADRATWGSLYNVFEIIESDVNSRSRNGKKLKDRQWIAPKQLKLFCATANDFNLGGDTARHQNKPQKSSNGRVGMEIAEGETLIRRLLTQWLNSKV
jgi:hypothetical protein